MERQIGGNPSSSSRQIDYELKLIETTASTGYVAAIPSHTPEFEEGMAYLGSHPLDDFMRKNLIGLIQGWRREEIEKRLKSPQSQTDEILLSLICEACLLDRRFNNLLKIIQKKRLKTLLPHTSQIYLKSYLLTDHEVHSGWAARFQTNIYHHRPLPAPEKSGLPLLLEKSVEEENDGQKATGAIRRELTVNPTPPANRMPARQTAQVALERLEAQNILESEEMRHESSLSPYALLRRWKMNRTIENRRMNYRISGIQTAYGKGIELDAARASYAMEIVERYSAYAAVGRDGLIQGTRQPYRLIYGTRSELLSSGHEVIDPNSLGLEVPYENAPLHWLEAQACDGLDRKAVLIPFQCVFLFSNLDEISLYSGLGSTGLASGNTLAEAKLSALLEILERDCEAVSPYHPSRCFRVVADDPKINTLLQDYRQRGIHVQFQDISPAYGIPCCKAFVVHRDGSIAKGACAHLDGQKAVLSALMETPYPYPYGPPSMPITLDLPVLRYEDLPNLSFNDATLDLQLLENVLCANGLPPCYVDLTHSDLDLPVVKALIPGVEYMNDFDGFARISPRLFSNYLKIYGW